MNFLTVLLQDVAAEGAQKGNGMMSILMMVVIFVIFYLFMIRPQSKKQKEIQKQRAALKAGDSVVTSGGIYGKVKEIKDTTILVEVADNVRIKVDKNSVFVAAEDIQNAPAK